MATAKHASSEREAHPGSGHYAHIVGWGMAVPERIMTNDDLAAIVETSDAWIRERTGIAERRIASERESTATLGYRAAQNALDRANILPVDLDLIIVATSTPEHVFPSTASLIQDWLGAGKAGAFDLSAACSGFVYALNMAAQAIKSGSIRTALVVGAETMSRVLDWQDRSTCILFGDGAGAVVLEASTTPGGILSSVLRSDGAGSDLLCIPTINVRDPEQHKVNKMTMAGGEVFKFATRVVEESLKEVAALAELKMDDLRVIIPHQANQRILLSAARKLGIEVERFVSNIERYGNTSAASIPIALFEAVEEGRIREGDHVAFVGFGGGLAWAAMVIKWGIPESRSIQTATFGRQRRQAFYIWARLRARIGRIRRAITSIPRLFKPSANRLRSLQKKIQRDL